MINSLNTLPATVMNNVTLVTGHVHSARSFKPQRWNIVLNILTALLTMFSHQVVNIPSFIVRLDSQKHIDFSLKSPFGGGRPGRVKRKNAKKGDAGGGDDGGSDDE